MSQRKTDPSAERIEQLEHGLDLAWEELERRLHEAKHDAERRRRQMADLLDELDALSLKYPPGALAGKFVDLDAFVSVKEIAERWRSQTGIPRGEGGKS